MTKQLNVIKRFLHEASEMFTPGTRIVKGNCWWMKCWTTATGTGKAPAGAALLDKRPEPQAVERAIDRLRSNSEFVPLAFLRWRERVPTGCTASI